MYKHANMNRVYRLVWNEAKQVWQAVQEKSKGKGKCKVYGSVGTAMTVMSLLFASPSWGSDVVVKQGTGNAKVTQAANGVTVVDINDPNRTGLSHNKYSKYNVDQRGLVLNNGDASKTSRQSVLAGQVFANQNLNKQANIILNEVVDPNRSALAGYTEVLGGKADVVVANPYGITCSGCGFINTDRASARGRRHLPPMAVCRGSGSARVTS